MSHPTSSDVLDRLSAIRPDASALAADWPADRRDAVLDQTLDSALDSARDQVSAPASLRPLRWRGIAAASVVAAAGLVGTALVLPGMPSGQASALDSLARAAAARPAVVIPAGEYAHLVTTSTQAGFGPDTAPDTLAAGAQPEAPTRTETRSLESWIAADGTMWRHDVDRSSTGGSREAFFRFCLAGTPTSPSPAFLASLPTSAGDLDRTLRAQAQGSTSLDEAVFTALGDLLKPGFAPPALRAAAIDALSALPGVTATATTDTADPAGSRLDVSFRDEVHRPGVTQTLSFDPATTLLTGERLSAPGEIDYTARYAGHGLVASVPASVVAQAHDECSTAQTKATTAP